MQNIELLNSSFQSTLIISISWTITFFILIMLKQQAKNMIQNLLIILYDLLLTIKF
jgi:hypothetical protein